MPFVSLARYALVLLLVVLFVPSTASSQDDPVMNFITEAASMWTDGGEEALSKYVAEHPILAGAAVAKLLDYAIETGDGGNKDEEKENIEFAELVARLYKDTAGSGVALDHVNSGPVRQVPHRAHPRAAVVVRYRHRANGAQEIPADPDFVQIHCFSPSRMLRLLVVRSW